MLLSTAEQNMNKSSNILHLQEARENKEIKKLQEQVSDLLHEKRAMCEQAVKTMLRALDAKDNYTYGHSLRVAYYSLALGREYGLNEEQLYDLEMAALFHDVGKIGVPDSVLLKPSRLEEDEFLKMKKHPSLSAEILQDFEVFKEVATFAKHHHERYDGRGYPDGLKGEGIPLFSRIILIADTFDAMTSTRPYRKGLSYDVAFAELKEFSGSQFDPNLVPYFIAAMTKEQQKNEPTFRLSLVEGSFIKDAA
jgi:putative nucleotidyltransferase with HDIG domain